MTCFSLNKNSFEMAGVSMLFLPLCSSQICSCVVSIAIIGSGSEWEKVRDDSRCHLLTEGT